MEMLQLRCFLESATYESFAKTADKFKVPATSVSASVKRLEKELGCLLFSRTANKIKLNDIGNKTINAVMPEVFPKSSDSCLLGTDSDDHRQDMSDEAERILEIFTNTNMCNYWQARPKKRRNYHTIADEATWKKRVDYLKHFDVKLAFQAEKKICHIFRSFAVITL